MNLVLTIGRTIIENRFLTWASIILLVALLLALSALVGTTFADKEGE